jgi:quinol monooxygenase YgiN
MSYVGLLVRLEAKPEKAAELAGFLKGALPAVKNEPGTTSWFAFRIAPTIFGIYDSFPGNGARQKHLSGPIAGELIAKAPELLAKPPKIEQVDILASKLVPNSQVDVALLALFEAKAGKENELADHLSSAGSLMLEEPRTKAWFAIRLGPSLFGIYDAFPDDTGSKADLPGDASDAGGRTRIRHPTTGLLMVQFSALLVNPPSIEQVDVLAAKFPK